MLSSGTALNSNNTHGVGFDADKFGVFSTFSAFLEMAISKITMARLNNCNVRCHFSQSGGGYMRSPGGVVNSDLRFPSSRG